MSSSPFYHSLRTKLVSTSLQFLSSFFFSLIPNSTLFTVPFPFQFFVLFPFHVLSHFHCLPNAWLSHTHTHTHTHEHTHTHMHTHTDRQTLAPSLLKPMLSAPPSKPNEVELNVKGDPAPASNNDPPPRKPPSKDAPVRWAALGIFLGVMIPLMLTIIVLVALP